MSLQLDQVVPWGRSLDEYTRMFDLTEAELEQRIIGVGDGPASFNAQMRARRHHVVSIDPIYAFTAEQIRARVHETHERLVAAADENRELFNWDHIKSPQEMGRVRMAAMEGFLADFDAGKGEGRYLTASLPKLPFADSSFDLALCSHLLFLYTQQISFEDHIAGIIEMARVAREVRIFPLLMLGNTPSPHVSPAVEVLASRGYACEIRRVPYEFQKGGNEMLVVRGISAGST